MLLLLTNALVHATERLAMRRQHQSIRGQILIGQQGVQVQRQGIRKGLGIEHADIGGDTRQKHVTGNQHLQFFTVQRHMLGSVAVAHDQTPGATGNHHTLTIHQAHKTLGHRRHHRRVVIPTAANLLTGFLILQAMTDKMRFCRHTIRATGFRASLASTCPRPQPGGRVVRHADPQGGIPALAQPVRQTDMIRVHVSNDHAQHGQAFQLVLENLFPQLAHFGTGDATVHNGPALAPLDLVAQ